MTDQFDYTEAQADAAFLLAEFGAPVDVTRVVSSYDELEGVETVTEVTTVAVQGVTLPAAGNSITQFDNAIVEDYRKGKVRIFMVSAVGLTFEPEAGDLFTADGKIWDVLGVTPLAPAGVVVLHTLAVRPSALTALPVVGGGGG